MDLTQLEKNLTDALTAVVNDEATLQAAIDAVKGVVNPPVNAPDPTWDAVKGALKANGWSEPVTTPETPPSE
jgi:hypothetical protein